MNASYSIRNLNFFSFLKLLIFLLLVMNTVDAIKFLGAKALVQTVMIVRNCADFVVFLLLSENI